jgi:hypothetical protein
MDIEHDPSDRAPARIEADKRAHRVWLWVLLATILVVALMAWRGRNHHETPLFRARGGVEHDGLLCEFQSES